MNKQITGEYSDTLTKLVRMAPHNYGEIYEVRNTQKPDTIGIGIHIINKLNNILEVDLDDEVDGLVDISMHIETLKSEIYRKFYLTGMPNFQNEIKSYKMEMKQTPPVICKYCNKEFLSKEACASHNKHPCVKDPRLDEMQRKNTTGPFCEYCQMCPYLTKDQNLSDHYQKFHEGLEEFLNRILPDALKFCKKDDHTEKMIDLYTHLTKLAIAKYSSTEEYIYNPLLDANEFEDIIMQIGIFVHRFSKKNRNH